MTARPRLTLIVLSMAFAIAAFPAAAAAGGAGGAVTDDGGIDYGAIAGDNRPAAGGGRSRPTTGPTCTYTLMAGPQDFPVYDVDGNRLPARSGGNWYEKVCDGIFYGAVYLAGAPNAVDPADVAAGVLRRLDLPLPEIRLNPDGEQVVNLPTWLHIANWEPLTGTATVAGVTVRVTARPTAARWTFGDGTTSTCAPGIPWKAAADERRACLHTWRRSSASQRGGAYLLSATVTWTASFSVAGGAGGGALAPVTRTVTVPVRVAEVQAINTDGGR